MSSSPSLEYTSHARKVTVLRVLDGRYPPGERPVRWDMRTAGTEQIETACGETVTLMSHGGQSTPAPGWILMLTRPRQTSGGLAFEWTLYGLAQGGAVAGLT